jgi:SAM-dependent methyltransferase
MKQYSAACERNREPILHVLREVLRDARQVLEIGSGSGQHAVFFGPQLPHLIWQTSDLAHNHDSILAWQAESPCPNVLPPLSLDMAQPKWPKAKYDAIFSSNTCHIMHWHEVEGMFESIGKLLATGGTLAIYGPFNYDGQFTSDSNQRFDASLREFAAHMGLRDFADVNALAAKAGLALLRDVEMPANNRLLVWRKVG